MEFNCILAGSDYLQSIGKFLDLPNVGRLSLVSRLAAANVNSHAMLWAQICIDWLGTTAPLPDQHTAIIGLAHKEVQWKEFLKVSSQSVVLTWGSGSRGRTGHRHPAATQVPISHSSVFDGNGDVPTPSYCRDLSRLGVDFVGKTAEVGSVALARGGQFAYVWGSGVDSHVPLKMEASLMSPLPGDVIVDASFEHDSSCLFVFASGLVLQHCSSTKPEVRNLIATVPPGLKVQDIQIHNRYRQVHNIQQDDGEKETTLLSFHEPAFSALLREQERAVKGLGSQSGVAGVLTNHGRLLYWNTYSQSDVNVVEPINRANGNIIEIESVAFGHRYWFAITCDGRLFSIRLDQLGRARREAMESSTSTQIVWQPVDIPPDAGQTKHTRESGSDDSSDPDPQVGSGDSFGSARVVSCDCGSSHQGFVLDDGRVFTWGSNAFDMLGQELVGVPQVNSPEEVTYFRERGLKVVAIGCGGHSSWNGAFTLFLCDDNTLWQAGMLGELCCSKPQQIVTDDILSRHILSISCGENWAAVVASGLASDVTQEVCT